MKKINIILLTLVLTACAQSGYQQFYHPYVDARTLPNVELLGQNEQAKVYGTDNFDRDIRTLRAKRYIVIGYSSFNGGYEDTKNAAAQANRIGATLVLTNSEYTNTQTSTSTLFIPNSQTTYHSGSVYGGGTYGGYSGTSTTYGSTAVPYTTNQRRYDQTAVYLVKSTQKLKFGIAVNDLTPELRASLERNTGALADIVIEDTPAFYSNVLAGDVIIAIDGKLVKNGKHGFELMRAIPENQAFSELTVLRKGQEKTIKVDF